MCNYRFLTCFMLDVKEQPTMAQASAQDPGQLSLYPHVYCIR